MSSVSEQTVAALKVAAPRRGRGRRERGPFYVALSQGGRKKTAKSTPPAYHGTAGGRGGSVRVLHQEKGTLQQISKFLGQCSLWSGARATPIQRGSPASLFHSTEGKKAAAPRALVPLSRELLRRVRQASGHGRGGHAARCPRASYYLKLRSVFPIKNHGFAPSGIRKRHKCAASRHHIAKLKMNMR